MTMAVNHAGAGAPRDAALASAPYARANASKLVTAVRPQPWRRCSNRGVAATSGSATAGPGCDVGSAQQQQARLMPSPGATGQRLAPLLGHLTLREVAGREMAGC
jgi:hypothetical protein